MPVLKSFHYNSNNFQNMNRAFYHISPDAPVFSMPLNFSSSYFCISGVHRGSGKTDRRASERDSGEDGDGWTYRRGEVSYVKRVRGWPSRVNRLWAVSHSWHTHNYSISSTINGNALKLRGEIKQTPSRYSSNPSASTLPPLYPFTSESLHSVSPIQHSI